MLARYCPEIQELRQLLELGTILRELQVPAAEEKSQ
jgi:hypothetical protein